MSEFTKDNLLVFKYIGQGKLEQAHKNSPGPFLLQFVLPTVPANRDAFLIFHLINKVGIL